MKTDQELLELSEKLIDHRVRLVEGTGNHVSLRLEDLIRLCVLKTQEALDSAALDRLKSPVLVLPDPKEGDTITISDQHKAGWGWTIQQNQKQTIPIPLDESKKLKLNLRVDSFWRLRNGKKMYMSAEDPDTQPWNGIILGETYCEHWDKDGFYYDENQSDALDIIEEWKD